MEQTAREFLRALRGKRSQVQLARRLGYRGNPITDWERGERFPTAEETLRAASKLGLDVRGAFERFSPHVVLPHGTSGFRLAEWLSTLRGETPVLALAERSGCSRFSVSRWLRGQAKPRLPDFFRLVSASSGRLPEWIAELVPIEQVPSVEKQFRAASAARRLAFEAPWTEAVLRLLETAAYRGSRRHVPGVVAESLGISLEAEQDCLQKLLAAGVIQRYRGKFAATGAGTVDTQGGKEALHALKQHWARVAEQRLQSPRESDLFAYNVVSLSRADLEQVREKLRATFREIRSLVAASQPEEVAALINLHLVGFGPTLAPIAAVAPVAASPPRR